MADRGIVRITIAFPALLLCCTLDPDQARFQETFDNIPDRTWVSRDFWAVPLEDWQVHEGRLECIGARTDMRVHLLTRDLVPEPGTLVASVRMGLLEEPGAVGSAGIRLGIFDEEDPSPKAACYFGTGITVAVSSNGFFSVGDRTEELPLGFNLDDFTLTVTLDPARSGYQLDATAADSEGRTIETAVERPGEVHGLVALANFSATRPVEGQPARFWFDDWKVEGSKLSLREENRFGPIFWTMYTLSRNTVKLTAQLPPLSPGENQQLALHLKRGEEWQMESIETIDPAARTATFRIENWNPAASVPFRVSYTERRKDGSEIPDEYVGRITPDPVDQPLVVGGLTCQHGSGFPYSPLVRNLTVHGPDLLYFSGDQIYEENGNYGIIRFPAERAILSYLGKWYMFGWAFRDLMRDRPTICTPDDHDVFQGNIWGEGGALISLEDWNQGNHDVGGYVEPVEMVNVVHRTQCSHLPDPVDPAPLERGISVFFTDLVYGRVSFAILSDRMFKSSPREVATWEGRADHVTHPNRDPATLDRKDLKLLGDRQVRFLESWIEDWAGADMKAVLSQTVFANIATHHGAEQQVLYADLDSGGFPRSGRNRAVDLMRRAFAFHIVGDQHLPSLTQYGVEDFQDAGWVFCTPAIYVGYERRFLPERLGWKIENPPAQGLANTGRYRDGFGNPSFVYAVGNPAEEPRRGPRDQRGQDKSSGYGIIRFDQRDRTIQVESYRYQFDAANPAREDQFPGWPHTLSQFDNYGRQASAFLPKVKVSGLENPVIRVENERTGELEYAVRIKGTEFSPRVFSRDRFTLRVGDPDRDTWQVFNGISAIQEGSSAALEASF